VAGSLTFAIGVAVSPIPIAAIVLILGGARARVNGPLFAAGWTAGVAISATFFFVLAHASGIADDQPTWLAVAELAIGTAFAVFAVRLLAAPRRAGADVPAWLSSLDAYGPAKAVGLGVALSGANPKNLALALGGALALAQAGLSGAEALPALAAYTTVAAAGVLLPLAAYETLPGRSRSALEWARRFVIRYDRTLLIVLALVIGAKFLVDGTQAL